MNINFHNIYTDFWLIMNVESIGREADISWNNSTIYSTLIEINIWLNFENIYLQQKNWLNGFRNIYVYLKRFLVFRYYQLLSIKLHSGFIHIHCLPIFINLQFAIVFVFPNKWLICECILYTQFDYVEIPFCWQLYIYIFTSICVFYIYVDSIWNENLIIYSHVQHHLIYIVRWLLVTVHFGYLPQQGVNSVNGYYS